jgi:hypothetical protein
VFFLSFGRASSEARPSHRTGKIERDAQCGEGCEDARRPPWWHGQTAPSSPSPSQGARSFVLQPRQTGPGRPQGSLNPARARVELGPWSPSARACPVPNPAVCGSLRRFRFSLGSGTRAPVTPTAGPGSDQPSWAPGNCRQNRLAPACGGVRGAPPSEGRFVPSPFLSLSGGY